AARDREDHARHAAELARAHEAQLAALDGTITALRERLHRAEAEADAERGERQRLAAHLAELAIPARAAGPRKAAS
ncbi:MAG: hypothetical protein ACRDOC_14520, partial [Streptosporangiaceae bacterium]